jgi:hypothetical protein
MKTNRLSPATAGEESNIKIARVDCLRHSNIAMMRPPACRTCEYTLSRQFLRGLTRPNNVVVQSFWRGKLRAFRNRVLAIGDPGFPHLAAMALNSLTHRRDVEIFSAQAKNHRPAMRRHRKFAAQKR